MRTQWVVVWLIGASVAVAAGQQAPGPQPQTPVFRTGVDVLSVDATVVDRDGRQITDLTPGEFVVEVDGAPRPVLTAEYVRLASDAPAPAGTRRGAVAAPVEDTFFSTNARVVGAGRLILLLVDEGNIRIGQGREAMRGATNFVDALTPSDRVAVAAIPRGAIVDFTTDHERVREALLSTVGRASPYKGRFFMSLSEAFATYEHSDSMLRAQVIARECAAVLGNPVELTRCEIEVEQDAGEYVSHERQQTQMSLQGMREMLRSLAALDGPKSVILISEGLVLEGLGGDIDAIAAVAADVRASLDVLLLDVPSVDVSMQQRPTTPREDRERQVAGLEMLAGLSRGGLHRVLTSSGSAFNRILRSIAGHYLIGVESRPGDRDGRRHRISVKTTRRGVTVIARRGFLGAPSPAATSPADAVTRALRAPLTMNDIPMRLATWTYKEPGGRKVRLLITAEVERHADQTLEYTTGLLLVDRNNRAVATDVETRPLRQQAANPGVAVFAGSLTVDPGTYLIRFAAADDEGRLGSIERKVEAWDLTAATLSVGDLLVGQAEPDAPIAPAIEPTIGNGRLAAMMEVYRPALAVSTLEATLEIVRDDNSRPLLTSPLQVLPGKSAEVGVLQGLLNTSALPPGRYLARATVREAGTTRGHIVRPFRIVAASSVAAEAPTAGATVLPNAVLSALLAGLPGVEAKELVSPAVLSTVLAAAERARPAAKSAFALARAGGLGPAALDALGAGDQAVAAFLRGVDLFAQGQHDRALQQLQVSLQQAPGFAPTRLYLGAVLSVGQRHREAASLLQSVDATLAGAAPVARLTALSWLRAGDASNAIAALERARATGDTQVARTLAMAYVAAGRTRDALPLLIQHLESTPRDQEALLAALYALYSAHVPTAQAATLAADQARARTWAKAYAGLKGEHQALIDAWLAYLDALP